MKKSTFYLAFAALLLANIFVYSCRKENIVTAVATQTTATEVVIAGDRQGACPDITLTNATGLTICGVDNGLSCVVCGFDRTRINIISTPVTLGFTASSVFSLTNPGITDIIVTIDFNCGGVSQVFKIPAGTTVKFGVFVTAASGCCQAAVVDC